MDKIIREKRHNTGVSMTQHHVEDEVNPYAELERYLDDGLVSKSRCPEPIPWWGVSTTLQFADPQMLMMIIAPA
jgi:hypothetical protein